MRLIDVDAIKVWRCPQSIAEMREWIDGEQTVDAVPVKWLKEYFSMRGDDLQFTMMMNERNNKKTDIGKFAIWTYKTGAASKDCETFDKLESGEISVEKCIDEFREHNKISKSQYISKKSMRTWLRGLGYHV